MTPRERAGPRGRITLMRAAASGEIEVSGPPFAEAMYYCLGCRACETACPAGVEFGRLLEAARAAIDSSNGREPWQPEPAQKWLLDRIVGYPARLRWTARSVRFHQRSLSKRAWWQRWVSNRFPDLHQLESLAPEVPRQGRRWRMPATLGPSDVVTNGDAPSVRGTVALHPGCVQSVFLPDINADTAQVLAYNAWQVMVPAGFRCCGALHAHYGQPHVARSLARKNILAFEASNASRLISNAAGCGAHMKAYGQLLAADQGWAKRADRLAAAVVDVTEYLVDRGVRRPRRPLGLKATYHDACHLIHGQRVVEAPRLLLRSIPGIDLAPLPESTWCCGSAGLYNVTHPEAAAKLQQRKVGHILTTGAELVVTGNPGCTFQIAAGLRAAGSPVRVVHPATVLRIAYELPPLLPRRRWRSTPSRRLA